MLSKRMKTIASFVEKGVPVVDIGCDHALLDIYLTLYNDNICIASDINANALANAKKNIQKYHLEQKIPLVLSNGLEEINIPKHATVVISGMGTSTILNILNSEKRTDVDYFILSSHNEHTRLRKELVKLGYSITEEMIVEDRHKFYLVIKCQKGASKYTEKEYFLGPLLQQKKEDNIIKYYQELYHQNERVLQCLPWHYQKKRRRLRKQNNWLKNVFLK